MDSADHTILSEGFGQCTQGKQASNVDDPSTWRMAGISPALYREVPSAHPHASPQPDTQCAPRLTTPPVASHRRAVAVRPSARLLAGWLTIIAHRPA